MNRFNALSNFKFYHKFFLRSSFHLNLQTLVPLHCYHSKSGSFGFNPEAEIPPSELYEIKSETFRFRNENPNLHRYIAAYREYGHLKANINPLQSNNRVVAELNPDIYGLYKNDEVSISGFIFGQENKLSIAELEKVLQEIYCGQLGAEFSFLPSIEEREWFADEIEKINSVVITNEEKKQIGADLLRSQVWDHFMTVKFPTTKRYGAEGAESSMTFYREMFKELSKDGVDELVFGMCHRGRINLLTDLLEVPPEVMFHKLKGFSEFHPDSLGTGDVLSHFISSVHLNVGGAKPLHVTMLYNPSHLEIQDPVACGKARGRQRRFKEGHYSPEGGSSRPGDRVVCFQVHGDGALSGQGVLQETLGFASVPHFCVGGSIHMCINNQISYTTPPERGRSSLYCTDIAKMCSFPVIHVNGDNPEAVAKAARLAVAYNRKFRRDVFVDLCCWRRWGHNEMDDPRFTNPGMYKIIDNKMSVPDAYAKSLVESGVWSQEELNVVVTSRTEYLAKRLSETDRFKPQLSHLLHHWSAMTEAPDKVEVWDTGVDVMLLKYLGAKSVAVPEGFVIHPHLEKTLISARLGKLTSGQGLDWATGEALAMASLIHQGYDVRLSGEDVGRGTFSQRHCMLVDQDTDEISIPLNEMDEKQSNFLEVANSTLSEEGVLGFEYGVSIECPNILCIWEAQFGDFFNGAQTVFDTFVSSGEEKWLLQSGLVIMLPHGFDGAGPEHSSCRMERFLQMSNSSEVKPDSERVNWNIVFPTTAAQIFHVLRRQMLRNYRKPLIVIGPKSILRMPASFSSLEEMAPGTYFQSVIGDPEAKPESVSKVIFVSGKHFYLLRSEREKRVIKDTAIIRLESLCPFPTLDINKELAKYPKAKSFIWSQEEHRNMGAWSFVSPRFRNLCGTQLKYAGRNELGAVAVGISSVHKAEVEEVLNQTFQH